MNTSLVNVELCRFDRGQKSILKQATSPPAAAAAAAAAAPTAASRASIALCAWPAAKVRVVPVRVVLTAAATTGYRW